MKENLISESVLCSLIKTQPLKSTRESDNKSGGRTIAAQKLSPMTHRGCTIVDIYTAAHGRGDITLFIFATLLLVGTPYAPRKKWKKLSWRVNFR